jgi:hypothetical protein
MALEVHKKPYLSSYFVPMGDRGFVLIDSGIPCDRERCPLLFRRENTSFFSFLVEMFLHMHKNCAEF